MPPRRPGAAAAAASRAGRLGLRAAAGGLVVALALCACSTAAAPPTAPLPAVAGRAPAGAEPESISEAAPFAIPGRAPRLPWPRGMQGALAVAGYGLLGATPGEGIRPIASVAKVMTAYQVLLDHPLGRGRGPLITVTAADVALLRYDIATGQSTVRVVAGERISESQALLALLLPSANNVATLLARWDAGSLPAFVARMNATARALGLTHTRYADASGFDPRTVSTATDQVRLATTALRNAAFAKLVSTPATRLPYAGLVRNVNALLGHDGVIGVKTGTTGWAGACLVFAAVRRVGGRRVLLVGALLGGPHAQFLGPVFQAAVRLLAAGGRALDVRTAIPAGAVVAQLRRGGTQLATVAAARPVRVIAWPGMRVSVSVSSGAAVTPDGPLSVTATIGYQQVRVTATVKPATGWTPRR